jgi:hypothetical protein
LLQAANEGASEVKMPGKDHSSLGIRIELPCKQDVNRFVDQVFEHRIFFSRQTSIKRQANGGDA